MVRDYIEQLAKQIHQDYNRVQLQRHPEKPLQYPTWDSLPETLKRSNLRQAQTIEEKLRQIDCYVDRAGKGAPYALSEGDIEYLARYEHDLWAAERWASGWEQGEEKDAEREITPYLIPYDDLTEEIKELDRDVVRNIPNLLAAVGLAIYKAE